MSWVSEAREFAKILKVEAEFLLHEELQKQTLRAIYLNPRLREITLHGGTALRLVYGSPRFSLDLDFTGKPLLDLSSLPEEVINSIKVFEEVMGFSVRFTAKRILKNKHDFLRFNLDFTLTEVKKKFKVKVELLEKEFTRGVRKELSVKHPVPTVIYVKTKELSDILVDKICAIAGKSYPLPRNIYDIEFIVRKGGELNREGLREGFGEWKETIEGLKKAMFLLEKSNRKMIMKEINMLLPEGAKINFEDADKSVKTTMKILEEAVEILYG